MRFKRYRPRLGINPIIVKELRSRMRGARAFVLLTVVLLLMGGISYALYRITLATARYTTSPLSPQIGQMLFVALALLELMMVCFITPAVTAGAISSEQEKLTYEMLLATPLRPASILGGKLTSALSYIFLLIFAAIPMASLVFIFGGVAPRDMIKALVILVAVAVTLGMLGLFMSAWQRRTGRATVLSYLAVLALLIGPLFVYILVGVLRQEEPSRWILVPNPTSALFSALTPAMPGDDLGGLLWGLGMAMGGNLRVLSGEEGAGVPRPLYHYTLPLYGAVTLVLYLLSTRLVQPTRRWRVSWKEVLVVGALFLVFGGLVTLAFVATANRYEKGNLFSTPTPVPAVVQPIVVEREMVRGVPPPAPAPTELPVEVSPLPTPTPALAEDDQAAIYAAVVRQLVAVDHTFDDGSPNVPVVYLVRTTDDGVGDPDAPRYESRLLPEPVQTAIVDTLYLSPLSLFPEGDLPAVRWVDDADQVPRDEDAGTVAGGGAIITLGNVHFRGDGSALVSAQLYSSSLGATGKTYVLEQVDGIWQVTGDTGGL
jgi:ABC-2 type transport system permease protein